VCKVVSGGVKWSDWRYCRVVLLVALPVVYLGKYVDFFANPFRMLRDSLGTCSQICEELAKDLRMWYGGVFARFRTRSEALSFFL